jgi:Ca-activated chloride channel homolog
MDWESPRWLLAAVPALLLLLWIEQRSAHRMGAVRKRALLVVRALLVLLALLALAGPARVDRSGQRMLGFVLDGSQSMGADGLRAVLAEYRRLNAALGGAALPYVVVAGAEPAIFAAEAVLASRGGLAGGVAAGARGANGLGGGGGVGDGGCFPSGVGRELVMIGDGQQTVGDVVASARQAAARQERIHVRGVAGAAVADLRLTGLGAQPQSRAGGGNGGTEVGDGECVGGGCGGEVV